ncbi:SUMF1/EgtB/PvdO family nonheme iron enzyme [Sphingobacterium sp. DR205]|uniref:formylglycine-generating enzyme family protein n=1 Tax=Sphingobacterium sp. DR205 TaxID=2713573 RepID=UPI0013E50E23|nr:SUMF1/EgtB/PvdO family nonheme iron enzyme [Sphingobacterium sp. DR205]QIH33417.1 formylglycine-generating enzyme family protein [Sphingobacterium sp. DR205]
MIFSLVQREPLPIDINKGVSILSDREAMGMPEYYERSTIDEQYESFYTELTSLSKMELVNLIENSEVAFIKRYFAGNILALTGDPRISTYDPIMNYIPSWEGKLGLNSSKIAEVVEEYKSLGVLENWIAKESPEYSIKIRPFKLAKYPVTNKEYLVFLENTKYSEIPTSWKFRQYPHHMANHPVYTVSEHAALSYCEWLSMRTKRKFRLPTEAEWEYAASSGQYEFPWGNEFKIDRANTVESGIYQTTPIGVFPAGNSPFGCCDMAGNIEEYVSDFYKGYDQIDTIVDDLVTINGEYRVARGGSFTRFRDLARCKRRHGYNPKEIYAMGFRLAESV